MKSKRLVLLTLLGLFFLAYTVTLILQSPGPVSFVESIINDPQPFFFVLIFFPAGMFYLFREADIILIIVIGWLVYLAFWTVAIRYRNSKYYRHILLGYVLILILNIGGCIQMPIPHGM